MVAGVGDDGVAGSEQRADRREVGLVSSGEDDRGLGAHPLGELGLELEVERGGAVQQARAGQAGAVAREGVARALHHPLVPGQPEVVVRAEHYPRLTLHLDHGHRWRLDLAEVGQHAGLARRAQLRHALVAGDLCEDVDGGGHIGWAR